MYDLRLLVYKTESEHDVIKQNRQFRLVLGVHMNVLSVSFRTTIEDKFTCIRVFLKLTTDASYIEITVRFIYHFNILL